MKVFGWLSPTEMSAEPCCWLLLCPAVVMLRLMPPGLPADFMLGAASWGRWSGDKRAPP